jgi:hypothetical protein
MNKFQKGYRLLSDNEPEEKELEALMHEVAVDVERKSDIAMLELQKRVKCQISEALVREGY